MPDDKADEKEVVGARDATSLQPLKVVKRAEDTGGEFVRIEAVLYPSLDAQQQRPSPNTSQTHLRPEHRRWMADTSGEHLHPRQEEYFKVLSGQLRIALNGEEQTLREGEEIVLPPRLAHRHWNPANRPARIVLEHRPALQSEMIFETLYESAQAGYADEEGFPSFLQLAVLQNQYPDHAYITGLPILVQKGLFAVLGPLGRLLGYRATPSQAASSGAAPSQESSLASSPPTETDSSRQS